MEEKIKKAKEELDAYKLTLDKVWNEDITDSDELVYMTFFKAGISHALSDVEKLEQQIEKMKCCCNCKIPTLTDEDFMGVFLSPCANCKHKGNGEVDNWEMKE